MSPTHLSRRSLAGLGLAAVLPGCGGLPRGAATPAGHASQASVLGLANERFFAAEGSAALEAEFWAALARRRRALGVPEDADLPEVRMLAVSGGGEDGAFGAGLLCGWSDHGDRPLFDFVTGVSTGALIAPFAYLGAAWDAQLRTVYTGLAPSDVLAERTILAALTDDALADNTPLYGTISRYVDAAMQRALAEAYADGRLLLIGTTDLDAQQPVFWNIGAIAASGHPQALATIRRVLLASTAIPGAFPPTMFDVTYDGHAYQEMHVDGGAFAQAFLYPANATRRRRAAVAAGMPTAAAAAYVIRNGRLDPEWGAIERRTLSIAGRAISTMIAASGYNDVLRIYNTTRADDIGFNLAYIGRDFTQQLPAPFDPAFMRALFDYGYQRGRAGYHWADRPPI